MAVQMATGIVITAGSMTFINEWYQTRQINWRIPIATLFLGAGMDVISAIDDKIANMLAIIILIGAGVTEFNGKSAFDTLSDLFNPPKPKGQPFFRVNPTIPKEKVI